MFFIFQDNVQELTNFASKSNKLVNCFSVKLRTKIKYIKMHFHIVINIRKYKNNVIFKDDVIDV